jgi:hypothetical protein
MEGTAAMTIDTYRPGGHWLIDDRTGERIRASDAVEEWNGAVVHKDDSETRHPQELIRPRADRQVPGGPIRSDPIAEFVGSATAVLASAATAGATALVVTSTRDMRAGDYLRVMLDNLDALRVRIATIADATHLTLTTALTGSASAGNTVVDESAVASVDIG